MRDYIVIGSTPSGEDCQQVGSPTYLQLTVAECQVFVRQLLRLFPNKPEGRSIGVKAFSHDFGTYHEVCVFYDNTDEEQQIYAYNVENNTPEYWDEQALAELEEAKIPYNRRIDRS